MTIPLDPSDQARFVAALLAERARLQGELARATTRLVAARSRPTSAPPLSNVVDIAHNALLEMERSYRAEIDKVRADADVLAERIVDDARHGRIEAAPSPAEWVKRGEQRAYPG